METGNLNVNVTFTHGAEGSAVSEVTRIPPGWRPIFVRLPALAENTAALVIQVPGVDGSYAPVDGYDEDTASVDALHIKCAATNARVKRMAPEVFAGFGGSFKLAAYQSDLSTAVPQAVGAEADDVVVQIQCRRY